MRLYEFSLARSFMDVNRAYVGRLILNIQRSINAILSFFSKPYENLSEAEKYAVRYNIIVISEAVVALALHVARRTYGEEPETPIHALSSLRDKGLISVSKYEDLARLTRLRNLLSIGTGLWMTKECMQALRMISEA